MLITLIAWVVLLVVLTIALISICVFEDIKAQQGGRDIDAELAEDVERLETKMKDVDRRLEESNRILEIYSKCDFNSKESVDQTLKQVEDVLHSYETPSDQ